MEEEKREGGKEGEKERPDQSLKAGNQPRGAETQILSYHLLHSMVCTLRKLGLGGGRGGTHTQTPWYGILSSVLSTRPDT